MKLMQRNKKCPLQDIQRTSPFDNQMSINIGHKQSHHKYSTNNHICKGVIKMNVERNAKCEECSNMDICKYRSEFINGCNQIKQTATSMGKGADIVIGCKFYACTEELVRK